MRPHRAFRLVAAGLFLIALAWQHDLATRLGYRVEKARQRIIAQRCANGALRIELETVLSPANLSAQARGRLKMSLVGPESLRNLEARAPAHAAPAGLLSRLIALTRRAFGGSIPA